MAPLDAVSADGPDHALNREIRYSGRVRLAKGATGFRKPRRRKGPAPSAGSGLLLVRLVDKISDEASSSRLTPDGRPCVVAWAESGAW
ncbi:hypothetical protein SCA03_16740 [Streptomyces cacaoi]|uniref:Uncharacterized protein n=1 Tax=Streptomyces cacaoi TaxID=1898 RepID=A0A4Y3QX05_STRCI|nr:hypothetical protein SCA03_16740 [Streptomyces cacaoi]